MVPMVSPALYVLFAMLGVPASEDMAVNGLQDLIIYLSGAAIVGLVGGFFHLSRDLSSYKTHVAETYVKAGTLDEIKHDVRQLRDAVFQIANKLEVPIFSEPYRR